MNRVLENLEPKNVFYYFEEISKIPRGSRNEQAISDYLVDFAQKRNLNVQRDAALNVVITKPATPGYENRKKIMFQGHMDMVCVKNPDVVHDFTKDPIALVVDGEYLRANGTSLGADDGSALALCLAILDDDALVHPQIQAVFTTAEEIGMCGALEIDSAMLDGDYLVGLDYSQDDRILISAAGASSNQINLPCKRIPVSNPEQKHAVAIAIKGLMGGHSGSEIGKNRANAMIVLAELLSRLQESVYFELAEFEGGNAVNAIPPAAKVIVLLDKSKKEQFFTVFQEIEAYIYAEFRKSDPDISLTCTEEGLPGECFDEKTTRNLLYLLDLVPNGLFTYLNAEQTLYGSSSNVGIAVREGDMLALKLQLRSNTSYEMEEALRKLRRISELCGADFVMKEQAPAFEYRPENKFSPRVKELFKKVKGYEPPLQIIHAGVETGVFIDKMKERGRKLDAVSLGVRNIGVHTTGERLCIASVKPTYELLLEIMQTVD